MDVLIMGHAGTASKDEAGRFNAVTFDKLLVNKPREVTGIEFDENDEPIGHTYAPDETGIGTKIPLTVLLSAPVPADGDAEEVKDLVTNAATWGLMDVMSGAANNGLEFA